MYFVSNSKFIPVLTLKESSKQLISSDLNSFIEKEMTIKTVGVPSCLLMEKLTFVEGSFDSFNEEFAAIFFPDGNVQLLPNFSIIDIFLVNGKCYFWGSWNYPETGWNEFRVFRIEKNKVVNVFSEDAFSN